MNDIGCGVLNWCIDCCVLCKVGMWIFGIDLWYVDFVVKECLYIEVFFCESFGVVYIGVDIREVFEVVVDKVLCFVVWNL